MFSSRPSLVSPGSLSSPIALRDPDTLATEAVLAPATGGALHSRPGGVAAARDLVEAEELGADPTVVEARVCSLVCLTLSIEGEPSSRETAGSWQGVARVVGRVVEAGGGGGPQEVLHLLDGAVRPVETTRGPAEVRHDVTIAPGAVLGPGGGAQVGGGRVPIVDSAQEVADLMGSDNHSRVGPAVLHQGDAADLGEAGVADTGPAHVGVAGSGPVHPAGLSPGHVQPREDDHHVVHGQGGSASSV